MMTAEANEIAETPAELYAGKLKPFLSEASKAYGSQLTGSPARVASDKVNELVLEYAESGAKMPALARQLEGHITLSGLRRRVRLARALKRAGDEAPQLGHAKLSRGSRDPENVQDAAAMISEAREHGGREYGDAVRAVYNKGIALKPVADILGVSYFALWSAKRSAY